MKLRYILENSNDRFDILRSLGYQPSNAIPGYWATSIGPPISERDIKTMSLIDWNRFLRDAKMHFDRHQSSLEATRKAHIERQNNQQPQS